MLKRLMMLSLVCVLVACGRGSDAQVMAVDWYDVEGSWLVLNYWAPWCKPCYAEFPALNALYKKYKKRIKVIGVSYEKMNKKQLRNFARKYHIRYILSTTDPHKKLNLPPITNVPITFIIDPQGRIRKQLLGPHSLKEFEYAMGLR